MRSLYVQNFGIQNKLALYVLQVLPSEVETEVSKGELIMNRQQATSGTIVSQFVHSKTVATSSDASHPIRQIITVRTDICSPFSSSARAKQCALFGQATLKNSHFKLRVLRYANTAI